jgi:predicted metal-dependent peptidase
MFATRILEALTEGKLDWRTLLNDFVQEEICDYSFSPPDRRFGDSDFFLPDFNEKQEMVKNVWFLIDTSGSISDGMIMDAYNEIASAVEIFGGNIESYLSFTESFVTKPAPFSSVGDLLAILPKGGGGNNFRLIFEYLETGEGIDTSCPAGAIGSQQGMV